VPWVFISEGIFLENTTINWEDPAEDFFSVSFLLRSGEKGEGPLHVLWQLIEKYKVDIFDVSLTQITADFLSYIRDKAISLEERSDFASMVTRLIFYKSRLLLPNPGYEEDSHAENDVLPRELIEKLLEYKKFQGATEILASLETERQNSFTREPVWDIYESGMDFLDVDLISFLKAFRAFLDRSEQTGRVLIPPENINIEEMMDALDKKLAMEQEFYFFAWVKNFSLMMIVVSFLAILEYTRLRKIRLEQNDPFSDIKIILVDNER